MSHQLSKHDIVGEKYQNEDSEARRRAVEPLNHSRLTAGRRKRADCPYEAGCAAGIRNADES